MVVADREAKHARARQLAERQLISTSDLEEATLAAAVARTDLESTRAQVVQAQASLNQALTNLSHATITAPIDGIVVQRSVDVGQTVAASLSSPTLFMIVGDLAKMRVSAAVDESDIAKVRVGQDADVTVDAFPGRRFSGTVAQVRLQPTVVSNVTTYATIIDVANDNMELKPGMTAAAEVETRDVRGTRPASSRRNWPSGTVTGRAGQHAIGANGIGHARTRVGTRARQPAAY
jgi:HlyD family secretion protein